MCCSSALRLLAPHFFLVMPDLQDYDVSSKQADLRDHSDHSELNELNKSQLAQDTVAAMNVLVCLCLGLRPPSAAA